MSRINKNQAKTIARHFICRSVCDAFIFVFKFGDAADIKKEVTEWKKLRTEHDQKLKQTLRETQLL